MVCRLWRKIIRTPLGVFSKDSTAPKRLVHNNARLTEGGRNRSGHVFVFGMENARAGLKKFDPGVKIGAKVAQKSTQFGVLWGIPVKR